MYRVGVKKSFSAAHRLLEYNGDCEQLHGHNFIVEVICASEKVDKLGIVIDFREIKSEMSSILNELDHKFLNDLDEFKEKNPSSENLCKHIYHKVKKALADKIKVVEVRVWESENTWASYSE